MPRLLYAAAQAIHRLDISRFCDTPVRSPCILRQPTPAWSCPQVILPYQPLDAVQTAGEPVGEGVVPDPTCARRAL